MSLPFCVILHFAAAPFCYIQNLAKYFSAGGTALFGPKYMGHHSTQDVLDSCSSGQSVCVLSFDLFAKYFSAGGTALFGPKYMGRHSKEGVVGRLFVRSACFLF